MSASIHELRPRAGRVPPSDPVRQWLARAAERMGAPERGRLERLGHAAGVHPTTLTRFAAGAAGPPKLDVLDRVALAAGMRPPSELLREAADPWREAEPFVDVPVIGAQDWRLHGLDGALLRATDSTRAPSRLAGCVAVVVGADTASLAGVLRGDTVLCDPRAEPEDGDLVVAVLPGGEAAVFRLRAPWLVAQAAGDHRPLPLEGTPLMGVARLVQRELR